MPSMSERASVRASPRTAKQIEPYSPVHDTRSVEGLPPASARRPPQLDGFANVHNIRF